MHVRQPNSCSERGTVMPTIGGSKELQSAKLAIVGGSVPAAAQRAPHGSKLKMSIERKIENVWLEAEQLGWSYTDFVSYLLEVLIVLNHRTLPPKLTPNQNPSEEDGNNTLVEPARSCR